MRSASLSSVASTPCLAPTAPTWRDEPLDYGLVTDEASFAGLRAEWSELGAQGGAAIFNSWEWLFPWYRHLGRDRQLMILTARNQGDRRLVGLLPLSLSSRRVAGRKVRLLRFLGDSRVGSDYLDMVATTGRERAIAFGFAEQLRASPAWDVIELRDMGAHSLLAAIFRACFADASHHQRTIQRYLCPHERILPGEEFDTFLRRTSRRDNYLRRRKWLARQPGFRIEVSTDPADLAAPLSELIRLHNLRWVPEGGGIRAPEVELFHREAAGYLAEGGRLRLYSLKAGGETLASVYGIVDQGKFLYYKSGYDPAWRSRSVGLVLIGQTFADALASGLHEYDFLRGTEPYKAEWTTLVRQTIAVRIWRKGSGGWWFDLQEELKRAGRGFAKQHLPAGITRVMRRAYSE